MRLKYYLRGIAAGVVVSTCILTISHNIEMRSIKNATMTDEEIVEAAKELGMVYEEDVTNLPDQSDREPATTNGDSAMYENSVTTGGDSPYVSDKQVSSNQKQNIEQNKNDTEENKVQTLTSRMGTGGGNVPLVMKIRCGCEGGGKGALIQEDKSATA